MRIHLIQIHIHSFIQGYSNNIKDAVRHARADRRRKYLCAASSSTPSSINPRAMTSWYSRDGGLIASSIARKEAGGSVNVKIGSASMTPKLCTYPYQVPGTR